MAVYQDDNARPHRARGVNDFLQQSGVNRMEWPACSPDLNPIENLWDGLDRKVRSNNPPPRDAQHLFQMLQAEWQALPQRIFTNLVNSMRTRCVECQNSHGGYMHYWTFGSIQIPCFVISITLGNQISIRIHLDQMYTPNNCSKLNEIVSLSLKHRIKFLPNFNALAFFFGKLWICVQVILNFLCVAYIHLPVTMKW